MNARRFAFYIAAIYWFPGQLLVFFHDCIFHGPRMAVAEFSASYMMLKDYFS